MPTTSLSAMMQRKGASTLLLCFGFVFIAFLLVHHQAYTVSKPGNSNVLKANVMRAAWRPALAKRTNASYWMGQFEKIAEKKRQTKSGDVNEETLETEVNGNMSGELGERDGELETDLADVSGQTEGAGSVKEGRLSEGGGQLNIEQETERLVIFDEGEKEQPAAGEREEYENSRKELRREPINVVESGRDGEKKEGGVNSPGVQSEEERGVQSEASEQQGRDDDENAGAIRPTWQVVSETERTTETHAEPEAERGQYSREIEASEDGETKQGGDLDQTGREGVSEQGEMYTPEDEQIVPDRPSVKLVLPSKLEECQRAVITLILQTEALTTLETEDPNPQKRRTVPQTPPLTPPVITLFGADPDAPHYEVYPFKKWHSLLCPTMKWSDCENGTNAPPQEWERQLGVTFLEANDPPAWVAEFFPDVSALSYQLSLSGVNVLSYEFDIGTVLEADKGLGHQTEGKSIGSDPEGVLEAGAVSEQRFRLPAASVQVWEEGTCRQPWNRSRTACQPLLNKVDIPRAQDFEVLRLDERSEGSTEADWDVQAGQVVSFVVRPIPDLDAMPDRNLWDGFRSASFNAILESDRVIQHANVSQEFDEGAGGYKGSVIIHDAGSYSLKVALHWVHGTTDLFQEPFPVSVSSHMQHMYSQCEYARSLVHGSPLRVRAQCGSADVACQRLKRQVESGTDSEPEPESVAERDTETQEVQGRLRDFQITPEDRTEPERREGLATGEASRCTGGDLLGRWLSLPVDEECRPPFCLGNRSATNVVKEWNGNDMPWVYAPYECQYHMFSLEDITACAGETGVKWIHVVGDSTVREIPSTLFTMDPAMEPMQGRRFETADKHVGSSFVANQTLKTLNQTLKTLETLKTLGSEARNRAQLSELEVLGKKGSNLERGSSNGGSITETDSNPGETEGAGSAFNSTKVAKGQGISERNPDEATGSKRGAPSPLRVTFQFFDQMYPMETGAHRDFEGMDRSLLDQFNVTCPEGAATCPDVIILSPAMAYALWKQNGSDFETWVTDFTAYIASALAAPRGPRNAPLRAIWYRSPFMFSQAHERSSPYISLPRLLQFDEASTTRLRKIGVEVFDAMTPTRTRPGTCYDGLHYLMATADGHMGHTSNMLMQMLLNMIFKECTQLGLH